MKRILVVDDEKDIAEMISDYLQRTGYQVEIAYDGREAIKKAKEYKPELITLDIMMPELDGFRVMEILKDDPETKTIPIILVSITSTKDAKNKGFTLGAHDFIPKPIDFNKLISSIDKIDSILAEIDEPKVKKILVVEDESDIAELIYDAINRQGFTPIMAGDGEEAVEKAFNEKVDIIILDLHLPKLNGFEVIKRLRANEKTKCVPIIVLTAYDLIGTRSKCILLGANKFLVKPFSAKELLTEIKNEFRSIASKESE